MKIIFTTSFDPFHVGTRLLAAYMLQEGHTVHFLQMKDYRLVPSSGRKYTTRKLEKNEIASSVLHNGHQLIITKREVALFTEALRAWGPDIVCFSSRDVFSCLNDLLVPAMRKACPEAFIIGGGFGPTFDPEQVLRLGADVVVRGEGEEPLRELVDAVQHKRNWSGIRNLAWMEGGKLFVNPLRAMICNLDDYPFPLYDTRYISHVENDTYTQGDMRKPARWANWATAYPVLTSRGCHMNCSYCSAGNLREYYKAQGLSAPRVRRRSINNIIEELKLAKARGELSVSFLDEFLVRPLPELLELFRRYKKEINLLFTGYLHPSQLAASPELTNLVVESGLAVYTIGIQSADNAFSKKMYNRTNNIADCLDAICSMLRKGVQVTWHYISTGKAKTDENFDLTLDFVKQLPFNPNLVINATPQMFPLKIFKGTPLGERFPGGVENDLTLSSYQHTLFRLRQILPDDEFRLLREDPRHARNPKDLIQLAAEKTAELHDKYLRAEAKRLAGREVFFWGCTDSYRRNKHLFKECIPQGMLLDPTDGSPLPEKVDCLPVFDPQTILPERAPCPIIIFSYGAYIIHRKIMHYYPQFTDKVFVALR